MPAQLPKLNLITPRRKIVFNKQLLKTNTTTSRSPFQGGMVNRIAKTPAGCGCGGAR